MEEIIDIYCFPLCAGLQKEKQGSTDPAFRRFMVPLEKQEERGVCGSPKEMLLTPCEAEEASWRRAGCLP